jgi:hypothetical protein
MHCGNRRSRTSAPERTCNSDRSSQCTSDAFTYIIFEECASATLLPFASEADRSAFPPAVFDPDRSRARR